MSESDSTTSQPSETFLRIKINGKWLLLSEDFVQRHPGGSVITQYSNADATHVFHAFHEGSEMAYKQLALLEKQHNEWELISGDSSNASSRKTSTEEQQQTGATLHEREEKPVEKAGEEEPTDEDEAENPRKKQKQPVVASYKFSLEKEMKIVRSFEALRKQVHDEGLMESRPLFYVQKITEVVMLLALSFYLQYHQWYLPSAIALAFCWQQLGWLTHEFCHHQPTKDRRLNDWFSLALGNVAQGFSRDWWKDKHNTHHAATNIVEKDGDIDLSPLVAMVPADIRKCTGSLLMDNFVLRLIPYQHLYFTFLFAFLRFSWCSQSLLHAFVGTLNSSYRRDKKHAREERIGLLLHWSWVVLQLWLLPAHVRPWFFAVSQFGSSVLIAGVVSYNHNSTPKFEENSPLLNNFAALHILTTRNMAPSTFVDWLWGGLNYQIEHHLFPTMPRPNLSRCSKLVREFCAENGFEYMVDDYWTGHSETLRLLRVVAKRLKETLTMT